MHETESYITRAEDENEADARGCGTNQAPKLANAVQVGARKRCNRNFTKTCCTARLPPHLHGGVDRRTSLVLSTAGMVRAAFLSPFHVARVAGSCGQPASMVRNTLLWDRPDRKTIVRRVPLKTAASFNPGLRGGGARVRKEDTSAAII